MRIVCSYCEGLIRTIEPVDDPRVSHGICEVCLEHYSDQWLGGKTMNEYLDKFEMPVLVVDEEGRVAAGNDKARQYLSLKREDLVGRMGGDVMECEYALQPGGCGKQVHCRSCAVRRTVEATYETGVEHTLVPAYIAQAKRRAYLLISTKLLGELVIVSVEPDLKRGK